eukprot:833729-Prorocentrum_minimum.AAC.1
MRSIEGPRRSPEGGSKARPPAGTFSILASETDFRDSLRAVASDGGKRTASESDIAASKLFFVSAGFVVVVSVVVVVVGGGGG